MFSSRNAHAILKRNWLIETPVGFLIREIQIPSFSFLPDYYYLFAKSDMLLPLFMVIGYVL